MKIQIDDGRVYDDFCYFLTNYIQNSYLCRCYYLEILIVKIFTVYILNSIRPQLISNPIQTKQKSLQQSITLTQIALQTFQFVFKKKIIHILNPINSPSMSTVPTLEQILNEKQTYSEMSEQPSFTLTDILEEPLDQDLIEDVDIHEDDMDDFFQDQVQQDEQETTSRTQSKVYQFPSLQKQQSDNNEQLSGALKYQGKINASNDPKKIQSSQSKIRTSKMGTVTSKISSQHEVQQIPAHQRLKRLPILPMEQIENMSFVKLKNVTNLFEDSSNTSIGIPTCISATGNRFLAVGTSMGNIVIFQIGVKGNKILGTGENKKFGYVSSISISRDNKYLVAGHESGLVTLWDLYYFTLLKQQINSRSKILQVLFCSSTSQHFISNDLQGNTYIYTIEKYIWLNLKSQKLLQRSPHLFYDIRYHELQSQKSLVALCTLDYVLLISIKPKINVIGKMIKPDGVSASYLANVQMGRCVIEGLGYRGQAKPMYDVLVVSWGKNIYFYRFMPSANAFGAIQQLYVYKHPSVIYNIEYLSQNIFVTLDKHQMFRTIRIDIALPSALQSLQEIQQRRHQQTQNQNAAPQFVTISMPSTTSKQPTITCSVIHSMEMQEEVIYQRFIKTKEQKYIKTFRNTVINCTFNSDQKEIFFISKNSVFRARLHKWTTFLSSMVNQQKNIKMAMKLAIELKNQNLNIFSQKVQMTGKKAEKSMNMFCEIGKIFMEEGLKDVKQSNIERARNRQRAEMEVKEIAEDLKELYEYTIEYFIELKCEKYLFQTIYGKIIKNLPSFQYWQLFIESLKSFILAQKLTRIPSIQVFKQILEYFSSKKSNVPGQDNMKLIDKMITNLESQSLHYQNAVSILAQNKLYRGLAYMCSANKDFISPCNKLLMRMIQASENRLENAEKEFFDILEGYLTKLINSYYINEKKIPTRIYENNVLKDISLWLSFQDTLSYFLKGSQQQQKNQKSQKKKLSQGFEKLLEWVSRLIEASAKVREKDNFHELINHLIQSLDTVEGKQIMKKLPQSLLKRQNITYMRNQLSLMLVKYGNTVDLYEPELKFYIKNQYLWNVKKLKPSIGNKQFTIVSLSEELSFMRRYFGELQLVSLEQNNNQSRTAYEQICQTKDDWCKYLYNFLIASIKVRAQAKDGQKDQESSEMQESIVREENQQTKTKPRKLSRILTEQIETKSQQLQEKSARGSSSSAKSAQLIQNKELIKSLFSGSNKVVQIPFESTSQQEKQRLSLKVLNLDLKPFPLSLLSQQPIQATPQSPQTISNNYLLVEFILKNFKFAEIDPFIESLIKLNSQLVIVYILEHYELQIVNKKIQAIINEEVKYFVVRKILKIIRKLKKEHQSSKSSKNSKEKSLRVWGNQYRSYEKKKQATQQSLQQTSSLPIQKLTQSTLSKPILLFYLNQLCKFKPQKRVYAQLKHNIAEYQPFILEVLEMMKKLSLNSCIGLIYQHENELNDAFNFYQLVYNERMEVNVKKLVLVQHCHGRFLRQIFNQMLEICQQINTHQQWMRLLEGVLKPLTQENKFTKKKKQQVIELIQKVYTANPSHAFIQQFGQVIQITLLQVSSHIPVEQISKIFSQYSQLMNKTFMLNCLKSTMHTYSKSIFIYETSNEMVINDQASQFERIYNENKIRGVSCMPICENCQQLIEIRDRMVLYKCSHMYHRGCLLPDEDKCRKCVLVEVGEKEHEERSAWDLENLKNQKKESSSLKVIQQGKNYQKNKIQEESAKQIREEEKESLKTNTIYRCLAFDDYLQRDEKKFDQFRRDYDTYLAKYE